MANPLYMQQPSSFNIQECVLAEYQTLRNEILERIGIRHQIISITLTICGVLLGFGLDKSEVALIYPMIAMFLAIGWVQNDIRIRQLSSYIRENLERKMFLEDSWEIYRMKHISMVQEFSLPLVVISPSGTFLFTQIVAISIGLSGFNSTLIEWILLVISFTSIIYTFLLSTKLMN